MGLLQEVDLDKATIDAYHAYVQRGIRRDLNSISLGPGKLPFRTAVALVFFGFCCLLVGILLITLRMRHVYLWDWDAQFLGPFFFIMFLLCMAGATYLFVLAKRRSNKYRSELYFKPIGDWGASCVHKSELAREEELKHDLKSGTTPHKNIKPRSEAYSQSSRGHRHGHSGKDNQAYDRDENGRPIRPEDRRGPPPDGRRGPPDGRRGPPPDRRGPPPDRRGPPPDRRGPPPDDRRDGRRGPPPPDGRRGPPPDGRRGPPPPDGRRGPPPGDRRHPDDRDRQRGPPPDYSEDRRPPGRRSPPPGVHRAPDDRRPPAHARGAPRFGDVEMIPDDERRDFKLIMNRTRDESDI